MIAVLLKNGKGVLAEVASAVASAEADITHIDMGDERAARDQPSCACCCRVRDRLHLADVMRTLKRTAVGAARGPRQTVAALGAG